MKRYQIAVLPGDGIGAEVIAEAIRTLDAATTGANFILDYEELPCGAGEYLRNGDPLPSRTLDRCREADAILLGAMGLPEVRWPSGTEMAPQLDIREQLDLYAGVRPIRIFHPSHSPLREPSGIDLVLYRESTEGLFWSRQQPWDPAAPEVVDSLRISRHGSERLFRAAFRHAQQRRSKCTLVDKANVLPSMAYFRRIFFEIAREFPDVTADVVYVDACALYLVQSPQRFDVMVTENMFGDILSDLAAGIAGGMGMAPSADIGEQHAVFQPAHGSAPDIAGQGIANPVATILSAAMMLEWLGEKDAATRIDKAVATTLAQPENRTRDLGGSLRTTEMANRILAAL